MGRITRSDVMTFSKTELVTKLSGQFDRINKKMREFNKLSETAGEDYKTYVKSFMSDDLFNKRGTLNKGLVKLGKMSSSQLQKLFFKTIAIGESPTMQTVNTYTSAMNANERDLSNTIQTQMEDLGIDPDIIQKFLNDPKQVYKFNEMLKIHKNVYNRELLKTFTEYADTDEKEMLKNMNRMIKAYEQGQLDKKYNKLNKEREQLIRDVANGDYSKIERLQEIQNAMDGIRGKDIR